MVIATSDFVRTAKRITGHVFFRRARHEKQSPSPSFPQSTRGMFNRPDISIEHRTCRKKTRSRRSPYHGAGSQTHPRNSVPGRAAFHTLEQGAPAVYAGHGVIFERRKPIIPRQFPRRAENILVRTTPIPTSRTPACVAAAPSRYARTNFESPAHARGMEHYASLYL